MLLNFGFVRWDGLFKMNVNINQRVGARFNLYVLQLLILFSSVWETLRYFHFSRIQALNNKLKDVERAPRRLNCETILDSAWGRPDYQWTVVVLEDVAMFTWPLNGCTLRLLRWWVQIKMQLRGMNRSIWWFFSVNIL